MADATIEELVRGFYAAFGAGDRNTIERLLSDDFTFSSPDDPELDRDGWFARCWANRQYAGKVDIDLILEEDGHVLVRYESQRTTGERFRNAEYLRLEGGQVRAVQVYYGATR
jgi:ketosteroid isomerase-like protein